MGVVLWARLGTALVAGAIAAGMLSPMDASAADKIKIGVLGDQSNVTSDVSGLGAVLAAKLAVEDAGGSVAGMPVEVVDADFQMKPDNASNIARRWFETEGVDAIADLPLSSAGLA